MFVNLFFIGCYILYINAQPITQQDMSALGLSNFHGIDFNESNWHYSFDKYYYIQAITEESKQTSLLFCRSMEMGLVAIGSKEENQNLFELIGRLVGEEKNFFWTSGVKNDDHWYWERTGRRITYTNWNTGEPNNGRNANCVELEYDVSRATFVWNANNCNTKRYFICEGSSH